MSRPLRAVVQPKSHSV